MLRLLGFGGYLMDLLSEQPTLKGVSPGSFHPMGCVGRLPTSERLSQNSTADGGLWGLCPLGAVSVIPHQ